jgi:signal transduction histidine kinase
VVADNGPGIPETMRESVFKRFIRLDRSRSTPGSGLGLSLVAAIAELHGITVTLGDNEPGLRVILPFPAAAGQRAGLAASA